MAVLFLIFLGQICPKWIKLDQIGYPHQSKNVTIKSCHIYRKDKNGWFIFDFFWSDLSKMDQTWSKLIKLDILTNLKMLKVVTFTERINMAGFFLDQLCPNWIKLDQIGISPIKNCWHTYHEDKNGHFIFDLIGSDLSKLDQTWSNWISSPI